MQNKVIDREEETKYIVNDINCADKNINKILLIYSDTGIGKSSIIKKTSHTSALTVPIITVETPPTNNLDVVENGYYISYIAEGISQYFQEKRFSFSNFLSLGLSNQQQKNTLSNFVEDLTNLPSAVFKLLCERVLLINDSDCNKMLFSSDYNNILVVTEYIKFMMKKFKFVLNINNIQNADTLSLQQLKKIMSILTGQYFIFEFTTQDDVKDNLTYVSQFFENVAKIDMFKVENLPIEYALKIINLTDIDKIADVEEFYKNVAKGNLYKLNIYHDEAMGMSSIKYSKDPIKANIEKLNYQQKLILAIFCINEGEIKITEYNEILEYISKNGNYFISHEEIEFLDKFIIKEDESYKLLHASIIDSFDMSVDNFAALVAFKFLLDFFSAQINRPEITLYLKNKYIIKRIKICSKFDPSKILEYLHEFKTVVVSSVSEQQGSKILQSIFYSLQSSEEAIKLHIIHIAYQVGFYSCAFELLNKLVINTDTKLMFECMLLNRLDRHDEVIRKCSELLKQGAHTDNFVLIINMIKMLSERSLNKEKEYVKTFRKIFFRKKYNKCYEYGFLLRNSQIVYSYLDSLKYIKKSISFFMEKASPRDAACSELTYSVQLARLGLIEDALTHFEHIKDILLASTFEKHIVYLNQSSLELLNGTSNENTLILLEKAALSATTNFDKIAILNNKLCWYIVHKVDKNRFEELKKQLEELLVLEPDTRLHRRSCINFSKYFLHVENNTEQSQKWLERARAYSALGDELGDCYIKNSCSNKNFKFLFQQKFYTSFITYWHFDLPMN